MERNYLGCNGCKRPYSQLGNLKPKVLECGHSVCSICLGERIKSDHPCPICRFSLTKPFEKYPINYDLILACEMLKKLHSFTMDFLFKDIENETDSENREKCRKKRQAAFNERVLDSFDNFDNEKKLVCDSKENKNVFRIPKPKTQDFLNVANYKNKDKFIYEIYVRLKNNETIYACDIMLEVNVNNKYTYQWKYGKLECDKDWIHVHCLSMSEIEEERYACVSLQDLKRSMEFKDLRTFLNVGSQKLTFVPANSSSLTLQFLKLCTGETGFMLKGSTVRFRSQDISIDGLEDELETPLMTEKNKTPCCVFDMVDPGYRENIDYDVSIYSKEKEGEHFSANELIVQSYGNCIFVQKVTNENLLYKNVVATLYKDEDIDLSDVHGAKVDDCGISICLQIKD